jgi:hypothetical protein
MTLASTPIASVQSDLNEDDATSGRWNDTVLLRYLNSGERQIIYFKPTSYVVTAVYQLVAGAKQSLPDGSATYQDPSANTLEQAVEMVRASRNMGADGVTDGESIYMTAPADMDELYPGWRSETAAATVLNVVFDPKDRTVFEVFPPQPSSSMGYIEVLYSAIPSEIAETGNAINLRDEYIEPLQCYMKYRAYAKDASSSQFAAARALYYWNLFVTMIGRKDLVEKQYKGIPSGSNNQPVSQ